MKIFGSFFGDRIVSHPFEILIWCCGVDGDRLFTNKYLHREDANHL
ncbi:MAG: hypothetical protein WCP16_12565 [Pseudanabaena sp. ELA645]